MGRFGPGRYRINNTACTVYSPPFWHDVLTWINSDLYKEYHWYRSELTYCSCGGLPWGKGSTYFEGISSSQNMDSMLASLAWALSRFELLIWFQAEKNLVQHSASTGSTAAKNQSGIKCFRSWLSKVKYSEMVLALVTFLKFGMFLSILSC